MEKHGMRCDDMKNNWISDRCKNAETTAPHSFSYQFFLWESRKTGIDTRGAAVYNGGINKNHAPLLAQKDKKGMK